MAQQVLSHGSHVVTERVTGTITANCDPDIIGALDGAAGGV
jgi:hypothetical protein